MTKEKSLTPEGMRLGDFVLPNKAKVNDTLTQFLEERKRVDEVDGIMEGFFNLMERMNPGGK